ncbi:velvet factor-domain-containing protein [Pseudomassariella vexata]|uniref:Velvet factor-domain-containing protein n=1 Tax=Pseudomassariella vexata TaxID=1141098 RepID=A0A1Y2DIY2_9PEZI|nr:velvet factor-domain-containing protein [Pseudomassariella vexata]ORY59136.1 velvet factor-domain-containing protein [Pseudomassariella vexata]
MPASIGIEAVHNASQYRLEVIQQPETAKTLESRKKYSRGPIEPYPAVQVIPGEARDLPSLASPYVMVFVTAEEVEVDYEEIFRFKPLFEEPNRPLLQGERARSQYLVMKHECVGFDNKYNVCMFEDLYMTKEGLFKLRFDAWKLEIDDSDPEHPEEIWVNVARTWSSVFEVFPSKKYPGRPGATAFNHDMHNQGIKISIRKDSAALMTRKRNQQVAANAALLHGEEDEEDGDDNQGPPAQKQKFSCRGASSKHGERGSTSPNRFQYPIGTWGYLKSPPIPSKSELARQNGGWTRGTNGLIPPPRVAPSPVNTTWWSGNPGAAPYQVFPAISTFQGSAIPAVALPWGQPGCSTHDAPTMSPVQPPHPPSAGLEGGVSAHNNVRSPLPYRPAQMSQPAGTKNNQDLGYGNSAYFQVEQTSASSSAQSASALQDYGFDSKGSKAFSNDMPIPTVEPEEDTYGQPVDGQPSNETQEPDESDLFGTSDIEDFPQKLSFRKGKEKAMVPLDW